MKNKQLTLLFSILLNFGLFAQNSPYASDSNSYYWKNRKPYADYWQQDVNYTIKATVDEVTNIIDGTEILVYTNNSPDELRIVYFHLYQNAFQPDSYFDKLQLANGVKANWRNYEAQKLGTIISKLQQNGVDLKSELNNTILKVYLNTPIKSGESTTFEIDFLTHFGDGAARRRMKIVNSFGTKLYNGNHFYPRISVYDRKFGWDTNQHLNREFYGDFGSFTVELNFAANYIVEATGVLQNESEVLPDSLRKKLDIKNFNRKPWNSKPSVIIPYDSLQRKIWKYKAINVHDFAFTASPTYRLGETYWNGIRVVAAVQEPHAGHWQNAAEYAAKIIESNSRTIGMYAYPKMVVADANDGMEFPMLTLDGGYDPNYRQLFSHEIGHNWFFAMIGNNETYRATLDEGFTQFLTAWALIDIDGDTLVEQVPASNYVKKHSSPSLAIYERVYKSYMRDAIENNTRQLNTHSDDFNGALHQGGGYREVYYKTACMLYNLKYVLGDSLFLAALQHYFNQWKIAHPYIEDFRNSIIEFTHVDLNWFFDEWIETTKTIDYSIKSIKKSSTKNEYYIRFKRNEEAQMPIDFRVYSKTHKKYDFHIPNTWFVKATKAKVLPSWIGWGKKLNTTYVAKVQIPGGIKKVEIDPTHRLADFNLLNNSSKFPIQVKFDHQIINDPLWEKYELYYRPDLWYNAVDGIKAGIHLNGNYLNQKHIFDANLWYNTRLGMQYDGKFKDVHHPVSFRVNYKTSLRKLAKRLNLVANVKYLDGLQQLLGGIEKYSSTEKTRFFLHYKSMFRSDSSELAYLNFPDEWQTAKYNNSINMGINHSYVYLKSSGIFSLSARSSAFTKSYTYSTLNFTTTNKVNFGKFSLSSRLFIQYTTGNSVPNESALYLSGANPEEMMDNKFVRSSGFYPNEWLGYGESFNHFHYGGGLNLRGYSGYIPVLYTTQKYQRKIYKGKSGASLNTELSFVRLFATPPSKIKNYVGMDLYLFGDAGVIDYSSDSGNLFFSDIRCDAGLGVALKIKKWGVLEKPSPLTIRFDMPYFVNRPSYVEDDFFKFRWILAIGRAF